MKDDETPKMFSVRVKKDHFKLQKTVDSRNKRVITVQPGWSNFVNEVVWKQLRLKCAWSFKRARPRVTTHDVVFSGVCSECKATLSGSYEMVNRKFNVRVENFKVDVKHTKKRRVTNYEREKIAEMLKGNSAYAVHSVLANKLMKESDPEPAHLPKPGSLRKVKFDSEPVHEKNPTVALQDLKRRFQETIQHIGLDPFYVMYCTPLQKKWYQTEFKKKRCVVSIDATGLGLRKLNTVENKYIFLYMISAKGRFMFVTTARAKFIATTARSKVTLFYNIIYLLYFRRANKFTRGAVAIRKSHNEFYSVLAVLLVYR